MLAVDTVGTAVQGLTLASPLSFHSHSKTRLPTPRVCTSPRTVIRLVKTSRYNKTANCFVLCPSETTLNLLFGVCVIIGINLL